MKKVIQPTVFLFALFCLFCSNSLSAQPDAFDLTTFLSGTKHIYINLSAEDQKLVDEDRKPMIKAFAAYWESMNFEKVAYTSEDKTQMILETPTLCDIAKVFLEYEFGNDLYTKHKIVVRTCNREVVYRFNQTPVYSDANLYQNMIGIWKEMYYQPTIYNKNNRLTLSKKSSKFDRTMVEQKLAEAKSLDLIEGVYEKVSKYNYSSENHTIGILKAGDNVAYNVYYLGGITNYEDWEIGELMGKIFINEHATDSQFKGVHWVTSNKVLQKDGIITLATDQNFTLNFIGHIHAYEYKKVEGLQLSLMEDLSNTMNSFYDLTKIHRLHPSIRGHYKLGSTGTGIALSQNGYLITNSHVVEGLDYLEVMVPSESKAYRARVVCMDKSSDLAILKIEDKTFSGLAALPYSFSMYESEVGENAFTTGFPLIKTMGGSLKLTDGLISAAQGYKGDTRCYQVSVPVNPGNSGGPLFNENGELVGVVKAKHSEADNVTYAIKNSNILGLMQKHDLTIDLPRYNSLAGKSIKEQVKKIRPFVFLIKGYEEIK